MPISSNGLENIPELKSEYDVKQDTGNGDDTLVTAVSFLTPRMELHEQITPNYVSTESLSHFHQPPSNVISTFNSSSAGTSIDIVVNNQPIPTPINSSQQQDEAEFGEFGDYEEFAEFGDFETAPADESHFQTSLPTLPSDNLLSSSSFLGHQLPIVPQPVQIQDFSPQQMINQSTEDSNPVMIEAKSESSPIEIPQLTTTSLAHPQELPVEMFLTTGDDTLDHLIRTENFDLATAYVRNTEVGNLNGKQRKTFFF